VARIDFLTCFSRRRKAMRGYHVQLGKRGRGARERERSDGATLGFRCAAIE
jgi:hypothetical protein